MKKIFYDPSISKWKAFEAPEKPTYRYDLKIWREYDAYEKVLALAKENALEVGNPEYLNATKYADGIMISPVRLTPCSTPIREKDTIEDRELIKVKHGESIEWPGTAVIRDNKYYLEI